MAGMVRRGSHSARHRAGRVVQPDEFGVGAADAEAAGSGLPGSAQAGTTSSPSDTGQRHVDVGLDDARLASTGLAVRPADSELGDQRAADLGHADTSVASPQPPSQNPPAAGSPDPGPPAVRSAAVSPPPPGPAGYGRIGVRLDQPGQAGGPGGTDQQLTMAPAVGAVRGAELRPDDRTTGRRPSRQALPRKLGRPTSLTIKVVSLVAAIAVVVITGIISVGPTGASVTAIVKTFLYDWETGNYRGAAAMTTGRQEVVRTELRAALRQLSAEDLLLNMGPITVRKGSATAYFQATIDLGRGGLPWEYEGHFKLRRAGAGWLVVWSPSVIAPGLRAHDRLAVITTMPARAALLDATGRPLFGLSQAYEVGVVPADVAAHPGYTAAALAKVTGLVASDADQMRGLIEAWPPHEFLELVQLSPASYQRLGPKLQQIKGVQVIAKRKRLFDSTVPDITGRIGTETSSVIARVGEPYRSGATVGESGLEEEYQAQLAGTPTTQVVIQNSAGRLVKILHRWPGQAGTAVRTTIDGRIQSAAQSTLAGLGSSAAIVAIRAGGGQILAMGSHKVRGMPGVNPLGGEYQPAQTFTIVSTAALLSWAPGFTVSSPVACRPTNLIGGQTFANVPAQASRRSPTRFGDDFARACDTAFVGASLRLSAPALVNAAKGFGIGGASWRLPLPALAFTGSISTPGNIGDKAAEVIGTGSVRVSPLDMALAAGVADAGTWMPPSLVRTTSPRPAARVAFTRDVIGKIRTLMRAAVTSGAANAANRPGATIYGQVGAAPLARHHGLWADWFVGFRGNVAFAVVVLSTSPAFDQVASVAGQFAASLPASALVHG